MRELPGVWDAGSGKWIVFFTVNGEREEAIHTSLTLARELAQRIIACCNT